MSKTPLNASIRLRFAPSPTGYLHIGGARTALFNYLYAKANNGVFVLRIEDTDQTRSTEVATKQVLASLDWLGIHWDEGPISKGKGKTGRDGSSGGFGPYLQSERLDIYKEHVERLLNQQHAYYCFCSDEELSNKRKRMESMGQSFVYDRKCLNLSDEEVHEKLTKGESHTVRFKVEKKEVVFEDKVKGTLKFDCGLIGDFVIRKSDGFPTYNFAVVVDDATMQISHVVRGDDHISNTPRQILIYQALRYPLPVFAHISMILGNDGEKLSKRYGAISVLDFKEEGYYPDPIVNFLALLGWSPKDGNEVIPRTLLEQSFTEMKFSSAPAMFDTNKLNFLNGQYLRNLPPEQLFNDLKVTLQASGQDDFPSNLSDILAVLKDYCSKLKDIVPVYENFMRKDVLVPQELKQWIDTPEAKTLYGLALEVFKQKSEEFIASIEFKELVDRAKKEVNIKGKLFFMPLRVKLTGEEHGIELDVLFQLKPRKEIIYRLEQV